MTIFPYINQLTGEGGVVCVSRFLAEMSSGCVCNYLVVLQAALRFCDELNVLAGESHQLTVACSQSYILKGM